MHRQLNATQRLIMWNLVANGGSRLQKEIRPRAIPKLRLPLETWNLVRVKRLGAQGNRISVTEEGWAWASENMGELPNPREKAPDQVLCQVLRALRYFLERENIPLAEVFATKPPVEELIRQAYNGLSAGQKNVRVRLAELRRHVEEPRATVDGALAGMMRKNELTMFRMDDPKQIRSADQEAAFQTPSGTEMHLVYLGGAPS